MPHNLIILGGAGDGFVALETVMQRKQVCNDVECLGFLNDVAEKGSLLGGLPVFGTLEEWRSIDPAVQFVPALHKIGKMLTRSKRVESLGIPPSRWGSIIHPTAVIARGVAIGYGNYIGPYVVIQPGASLGNFVSIRAGANIGHDARVEDFCYIGPNAVLCGRAAMRTGVHLAPGAVVTDGVTAREFCIVAAAAVVARDVAPFSLVAGNPGRVISHVSRE